MVKKTVALFLVVMIATIIGIPAVIGLWAGLPGGKTKEEQPVQWEGPEIKLLLTKTGEVLTLSLEQYVVGVLAAEMPAAFELEALKAQAVAARTYALKKIKESNDHHPQADVCDDPGRCQAWLSDQKLQEKWGITGYAMYKKKLIRAVQETRGLVLTYDNKLIDPVYHSTSGPSTENAEDVWQTALPYLKSVPCTWDRESPRYEESKTFTWEELDRLLNTSFAGLPVSTLTSGSGILRITDRTATGRIKELQVENRQVPATQLRSLLGLNSTNFKLTRSGQGVTITTTGFGHGVGMCQYGANGQAKAGRPFTRILTYYYTGVTIQRVPGYN